MLKQLRKGLSIKSKLTAMLLGVSLSSVLIVGFLIWDRARTNFRFTAQNQLTSLRVARTYQLESFFEQLRNHIETLSEDRMIVSAMVEFNRGYEEISNNYIVSEEWNNDLEDYYTKEFLPRLAKNVSGQLNIQNYIPQNQTSRYLQHHYIVKNPNPVGKKNKLIDPGDGSLYSKSHAKYHEIFRHLVDKFGYYDLFLIDPTTGNIIYTVFKGTDLGTNLYTGPYRESNLTQIVDAVRKKPESRTVQLADFQPYRPSHNAPVAFLAAPIYNGPHMVGILAIQMPIDKLDAVMTGNRNWKNEGLGETGETYLVGADFLMRSNSRFLIEDPQGYKKALPTSGTSEENIRLIEQFKSSILLQKVNTPAVYRAFAGEEGTAIIRDYRDTPVFSSYGPVRIQGLNWAIIAEKDLSETDKPIYSLQAYLLMSVVIIIVLVTWLASAAASLFLKPVNKLLEALRRVSKGELDIKLQSKSNDEFGELANSFNGTVVRMRQLSEAVEQKNRENDALLLHILPAAVMEQFKKGEEQIVNSVKLATILFAQVRGFTEMSTHTNVKEVAMLLSELVKAFDRETEKHDVTKIKTIGDRYIAACGVEKPRLDHTKRMMDFALEMFGIVQLFNNEHQTHLGLSIGIDDGEVIGSMMGVKKFTYDYWGETISVANLLQLNAELNTIRVTQEVYERLHDLYNFEPAETIKFPELNKDLITWALRRSLPSSSNNSNSGQEKIEKVNAVDVSLT